MMGKSTGSESIDFIRRHWGQIYFLSSFVGQPPLRRVSGWPMMPAIKRLPTPFPRVKHCKAQYQKFWSRAGGKAEVLCF